MSSNFDLAKTRQTYAPPDVSDSLTAPPGKTRLVYEVVAPVYSLSSRLFHSQAHRKVMEISSIQDGSKILEVAMGSGEMFHHLVQANPNGVTIGIDFSANMSARSQAGARRNFPGASAHCPCADACRLPFPDAQFDNLVVCYLFELLPQADVYEAISELFRVLKPGGTLTVTLVGQHLTSFNLLYKVCTKIAPAFWGRQVSSSVPDLLTAEGFNIEVTQYLRQGLYPTRLLRARRPK